jgi:hypothetical protein
LTDLPARRIVDASSQLGVAAMSVDETMWGTRGPEGPGPPAPPNTGENPEPAGDPPGPTEGPAPDDLVTRLLCAATYLQESFADTVARDLIRPSLSAMAPMWQVDVHRLVQHARRARTARRMRDRWLAAVLGCLLLTVLGAIQLNRTGQLSGSQILLIAVLLVIWLYVCAIGFLARQYLGARRAAVAAAYGPDDTAPTVQPRSLDLALRELNQANVVFFEAEGSPFLGSGNLVDQWGLTIDLSKGLISSGSRVHAREHKQPDHFTGAELQEYLLKTIPEVVDPRPLAGHRLHVRGGSTAPLVELFQVGPLPANAIDAMRMRRPISRVSDPVIQRYLHESTEAARVYTYFQHSAWGGQIVITFFVRAYVSNRTLFVEGLVYALRPLTRRFYEVRGVSQRPWVELGIALRQARENALSLLFSSPARVWRAAQNPLRPAEVRRIERELVGRRDLDFGAGSSLRERAATYYDNIDHFPAIDERMYHQIFNRRVLESIGEFVASKNVDTTEFTRQQTAIINRTVNLGEVYGVDG